MNATGCDWPTGRGNVCSTGSRLRPTRQARSIGTPRSTPPSCGLISRRPVPASSVSFSPITRAASATRLVARLPRRSRNSCSCRRSWSRARRSSIPRYPRSPQRKPRRSPSSRTFRLRHQAAVHGFWPWPLPWSGAWGGASSRCRAEAKARTQAPRKAIGTVITVSKRVRCRLGAVHVPHHGRACNRERRKTTAQSCSCPGVSCTWGPSRWRHDRHHRAPQRRKRRR